MKVVIFLLGLALLALTQTPPVWPVRFQQDFVESWSYSQYHDVGKMWYDS